MEYAWSQLCTEVLAGSGSRDKCTWIQWVHSCWSCYVHAGYSGARAGYIMGGQVAHTRPWTSWMRHPWGVAKACTGHIHAWMVSSSMHKLSHIGHERSRTKHRDTRLWHEGQSLSMIKLTRLIRRDLSTRARSKGRPTARSMRDPSTIPSMPNCHVNSFA